MSVGIINIFKKQSKQKENFYYGIGDRESANMLLGKALSLILRGRCVVRSVVLVVIIMVLHCRSLVLRVVSLAGCHVLVVVIAVSFVLFICWKVIMEDCGKDLLFPVASCVLLRWLYSRLQSSRQK